MPRLRRQARQKRIRPQLADGTKWDLLILTTRVKDEKGFWRCIVAAVKAGEIEISAEKDHYFADPPLIPMTDLVR